MNNNTPYQLLLKSIVVLMLFGQLWVNGVSYCQWMFNGESELTELCTSESKDSEEEENNKKEKDDRLEVHLYLSGFDDSFSLALNHYKDDALPIHHPEINTPPPEGII